MRLNILSISNLGILLALHTAAQAQQPTFDWAARLTSAVDDPRPRIAADAEGNVFVAYGRGTNQLYDAKTLAKLDRRGTVLWSQVLPAGVVGMVADSAGDLYITGQDKTNVFAATGITPQGNGGLYVVKYDRAGGLQWVRLDGNTQTIRGSAVNFDNEGNYYLAGTYSGTAQLGNDALPPTASENVQNVFVAKYDKTGGLVWARVGEGSGYEVRAIATDPSGNVLVTGDGELTFGDTVLTGLQSYLVKFDKNGKLLWAQQVGGVDTDFSVGVAVDHDGNAFMAMIAFDNQTGSYVEVFKYSVNGELLWSRQSQKPARGSSNYSNDRPSGVAVDRDGNCLVAGSYTAGTTTFEAVTLTTVGRNELFLVKYTSAGDVRWALSSVGKDPEGNGTGLRISDTRVSSIALSPLGACFVAGRFMGTVQFGATNLVGNALNVQPPLGFDAFVTHITDPDTVPPRLQITRSGNSVTISWPTAAPGYDLEVSDSIAPAPNWSPELNKPVIVADQNVVTIEIGSSPKFFRLRKP